MVKNARTPSSAKREEIEAAEKNDATAAAEASIEASNGGFEEPAVVEVPVNKKKKAAAEALNENVVNEDGAPAVTSSEKSDAKTEADGEKKEEAKKDEKKKTPKPVKRVVPTWASLSDSARTKMPKSMLQKPKIQDLVLSAFEACADSKGSVTAGSIRKYVMEENPDFNSIQIKKAVLKTIDRGLIKQVKGKGFTGSLKLESAKNIAKREKKAEKSKEKKSKGKTVGPKLPPLENEFPGIFTWACNPKESSVALIRKYLVKHYPELNVEENPASLRKALEKGESRGKSNLYTSLIVWCCNLYSSGQLKRVTGAGFSGTFALVDDAKKTGTKFEDALENAIIAMSEPKQVSATALRDYLSVYHSEYNTDNRPQVFKTAIDRAVAKGWIKQISGRGFNGTFRLMHPYYPAPKELWGSWYEEKKEKDESKKEKDETKKEVKKNNKRKVEDDGDDISDDDEGVPKPKKRGPPTPRKTASAPLKKVSEKPKVKKSRK